ncbi:pyrimidine-specific ribonucleoside hydrolase RihA-like isoform X1 [Ambystoma mexicanum]|uniref:pyrimidine-specific ribonucleoside hydrolase RihA-like isoform X1 n=1 Tax=Ambystoma mexicanum TaxID=8296 RepID=UPI0037E7EABE
MLTFSTFSNPLSLQTLKPREAAADDIAVRGTTIMEKKLILVDVDCGVDDAQAIMMALASPSVEILGITCCYGNTTLENVCRNVLRVLQVCDRQEIPVYSGAAASLLGNPVEGALFHGKDGLGDSPDPEAPGLDRLQKEHAVEAMLRIADARAGEVSLVATGPLTNLALAVKMDPVFPQKLKNVFIMGGNMEAKGNHTICGEFNFASDPEAAYIVLNEYTCPTYIATWEFTCRSQLPWAFLDEWMAQDSRKATFMKRIFSHSLEFTKACNNPGEIYTGGFIPCDCYAMAAAIDGSIVHEVIECGVSVEMKGEFTRGMMVMDMLNKLKKKNKALVINTIDLEKFKALLMSALK